MLFFHDNYHGFIELDVFSSTRDTLRHLEVLESSSFQEKQCYSLTSLMILILSFFYSENSLQKILLQNMIPRNLQDSFHPPKKNVDVTFSFFFFQVLLLKWEMKWIFTTLFIYRLNKHLQNIMILAHIAAKQWSINNIKVEYSQLGQEVSNFFWACLSRLIPDKLTRLLISSF